MANTCKANHRLAEVNHSFAQFFKSRTNVTNIFPGICHGCLLAKFGLYESYETATTAVANCDFPNPKEGPYLKAYKPTHTLNPNPYLVFSTGDVIIPTGQLLVDVLTADKDFVFTKNRHRGPRFYVTHAWKTELTLNPILYSYFRTLRDIHHDPVDAKRVGRNMTTLEQTMTRNMHSVATLQMVSSESDLFLLGNLLTPDPAESVYVGGSQLQYSDTEPLSFSVTVLTPAQPVIEKMIDTKSHYIVLQSNNQAKDMDDPTTHQIGHMNSLMKPLVLDARQAMVNMKTKLQKYFIDSDNDSAAGLYVSSFCYPSSLGVWPARSTRYLAPNCYFMEGVGLVATANICKKDLLVIDRDVNESELVNLKMCKPEDLIEYNPHADDVPLPPKERVPCPRGVQDNSETLPSQRALLYGSLSMR